MMKTTTTSILVTAAATFTLSALQPAAAQDYYGGGYQAQQGGQYQQQQQGGYVHQPTMPPGSQIVQFVDQNSPYGPVVAFEHAIPSGWQAGGKTFWNRRANYHGCGYDDVHYKWSARSSDGRSELGYYPQVMYSGYQSQYSRGNPYKGCENVIVGDPKTFLSAHLRRVRPNATIKTYIAPTPQEYADIKRILPPMQRLAPDTTAAWDIKAARFVITYEENGVSYDEYVVLGAIILNTKETGMLSALSQVTVMIPAFYMRAPAGQLDEKTAIAYSDSMRSNPQYEQMLKSISDAKVKQNAQRMNAQAKARMAASRSSSGGSNNVVDFSTADIQAAGWKRRNAITSAGQTSSVNAIGGVVRYNDPQSSTGYYETQIGEGERVFRQDDGSTVVTDDYFYNSGTQLGLAQ